MKLIEFSLRGVRCFAERQDFRIRPLTLLVGENSTGKTTALGCLQVLASCHTGAGVDFNRDPYEMGNFKNIISPAAGDSTFELGFTVENKGEKIERIVEFAEQENNVEPAVRHVTTKFSDGKVIFGIGEKSGKSYNDERTNSYRLKLLGGITRDLPLLQLLNFFTNIPKQETELSHLKQYADKRREQGLPWLDDVLMPFIFSTAPVRSRPKRTYDPIRESYDPEGSDVPTRLMRMQAADKEAWQKLLKLLADFGKEAQMFNSLEVRHFGESTSDPFQILVNVDGAKINIIDVGYGISQILPVLFRAFEPVVRGSARWPAATILLMQQPEVHLHPKAQAVFASSLVSLTKQSGRSFIVETHSRNIIDRVRIEITRGNIDHEDVSLIYLQPERNSSGRTVKAHNITFDREANMVDEPPHYAEFLMEETGRLFQFKD